MLPLVIEAESLDIPGEDNLLIVDLCKDENYFAGHLPGAVHVPPASIISGVKPAVGKLPDKARLQALLSSIGYSSEKQIVVYDDEGGGWAGRFLWTMDVIGHEKCSYLNGGLNAWLAAGRPVTRELPDIEATTVSITLDKTVIAEKQDVLASITDDNTLIWDARSAEEYNGTKVFSARGGHVPGAINLDWLEVMDHDNHLKLRTDLQTLLDDRGLSKDKNIITHCQTHHRSGLTYLAGKMLGYNIRAYHGSWSEWGNDPDTPIEC